MNEHEELIYGLNRWLIKAIKYYGGRDFDEFLKDEKSFDAVCYCISVISEIADKISKIESLKKEFPLVSFEAVASLYGRCFYKDNINLSFINTLLDVDFPRLLDLLMVVK